MAYRLLTTITIPMRPRTLGDRELPSSLNRTRSPALNFGELDGPPLFIRIRPQLAQRRMAWGQSFQPLRRILIYPDLRLMLRSEASHDLAPSVRPLCDYTFAETDLVFFYCEGRFRLLHLQRFAFSSSSPGGGSCFLKQPIGRFIQPPVSRCSVEVTNKFAR